MTEEIKKEMLQDPHALVIPDGTEVIKRWQYKETDYERVFVPKSITKIEDSAFKNCKKLKEVVFEEGSKLEEIRYGCFVGNKLEEITLPKTLKEIDNYVFDGCNNLRTIYVEDGCEASLSDIMIYNSVLVGPPPNTVVGGVRVWDLRK